jgi:hypothetical protein
MGSLNILQYSSGQFQGKETLPIASLSSLAFAAYSDRVYVAWTSANNSIYIGPINAEGVLGMYNMMSEDSSYVGPALAAFNNQLYMAYSGTDQNIRILSSSQGDNLGNKITLSNMSYVTPALAVFNGLLYLAHTGTDNNLFISSTSDGQHFGNQVVFQNQSNSGPTLAVFNNRLYMAYTGTDSKLYLWSSADGINFENLSALANTSNLAPALAVYNNSLYMAFTGTDGRLNIWYSTDGTNFGNQVISDNITLNSPTLAAFGKNLYLGFTGEDGSSSESVLAAFEKFVQASGQAAVDVLEAVFTGNWSNAKKAMSSLLGTPAFWPVLETAYAAGFKTIGLVAGAEGGVIVGAGTLVGLLTGTASDNQSNFYSYADVGISIGATEGGVANIGLYVSTEEPDDIGGLEFFTEVSGDVGVGAAIVGFVTVFNGTGAIALVNTGEEVEASVGVGIASSSQV